MTVLRVGPSTAQWIRWWHSRCAAWCSGVLNSSKSMSSTIGLPALRAAAGQGEAGQVGPGHRDRDRVRVVADVVGLAVAGDAPVGHLGWFVAMLAQVLRDEREGAGPPVPAVAKRPGQGEQFVVN